MNKLDIIIPVYKGLEETKECIISLYNNIPSWAHVIIINDYSPDIELVSWLQANETQYRYELLSNPENLGFVGTVNRGMQLHLDHDVLLLNSDVELPNSDWLERTRTAAYSHPKLASLTPFSNNATICSFPNFCEDNELFGHLDVTELDTIFSSLNLDQNLVEIPTGVGFCMYIRRDCLDDIGFFDQDTFGKGYGEENDWCQRAIKAGWKNYHQLNVFAYHKGGVSFEAEGNPRKEKALELLSNKHPNYSHDVQVFIQQDPASEARLLAQLSILGNSNKKNILLVTHRLGGGVENHLSELSQLYKKNVNFLKLTPYEDGKSVALYFSINTSKAKIIIDCNTEYPTLLKVLTLLNVSHIHFHHIMGIHPVIWGLPNDLNIEFDITIHDYYMVNGNPTLTDQSAKFVGDDNENRDEICALNYPIPVDGSKWREGISPLLNSAKRIIYPSKDVANRFLASFNLPINNKTIITPHPDFYLNKPYPQVKELILSKRPLKVLVIGALSREKGADILEYVAQKTSSADIEFHLLGYAYRPLSGPITHGPYKNKDLDEKINAIRPDIIWYPARWPETYSYTLSIALERGYPVICPNIGAFGERIENRLHSFLLDWQLTPELVLTFWEKLINNQDVSHFIKQPKIFNDSLFVNDNFYSDNYLSDILLHSRNHFTIDVAKGILNTISINHFDSDRTFKEKILTIVWKMRNSFLLRRIAKYIPYRFQRSIKRALSNKPIHDIIR